MAKMRRLTDRGIERFQQFIDSLSTAEPESYDRSLIEDPRHSVVIDGAGEVIDECGFANRMEAAAYLSELVAGSGITDPEFDRGLWCWFAWHWFESLCVPKKDGRRKPGEAARWVLNLDWNRYYRHLLAGPWWVYQAHRDEPERARSLLCGPITVPGELVGQIASRQELVSNPGLVGMITDLYFDDEKQSLKPGHATKGPGSARRLAEVTDQLDLIWDLYATSADEFMTLMPSEFDKFKAKRGA